ncbi:unnamed protein product [Owenia fusiformis]|uniref:Uncharacterized protein n=1 Tax=Owenia fusiformis TaxID=6347 RepID=A0A8J1UUG6_OWEFU|nr:unnamed protein product [Owenia fusiformis]
MPNYKLTYFNARGRAEAARLIFKQGGVEFDDVRIDGEAWGAMKGTGVAPYGQLPILEVDGKVLGQSVAIARFAARETGMLGENSFDMAVADSVVDSVGDVSQSLYQAHFEKDDAKKAEMMKKIKSETVPNWCAAMEKLIAGDYVVGSKMTWADIGIYQLVSGLQERMQDEEEKNATKTKYPKLIQLVERVAAAPNIAKWVKERPETNM